MTHETLVCLENVTPDQLSALRDEALPAGEAERLRAHSAGCAACRARMADYDTLAGALRSQRELDPGDRILDGVRARLAGRPGSARGGRIVWNMSGGRRIWAGLAALAPVAAIILLFVYVFAGIGRQPASGPTPTAGVATPTSLKPIYPTPTPATVVIPPYTPAVPAATAWGTVTPVKRLTIAPSGGYAFTPQFFSSDLTTVGGNLLSTATAGNPPYSQPPLALYSTTTGAITRLGPTGDMSMMDSQYIVYLYDTAPGTTCGPCHTSIRSLDRATGAIWQIDPGPSGSNGRVPYSGDQSDMMSADHVAFLTMEGQVWVADLATRHVSVALPVGSQPASASTIEPIEQLVDFQYPYLIYAEIPVATPSAQQPASTLNILDLATGVNTPITAQVAGQTETAAAMFGIGYTMDMEMVGNTLYATRSVYLNGVDAKGHPVKVTYGELYRLDNAFAPGGQFTLLARGPFGLITPEGSAPPNTRLIALGGGYFWDLAEQRLILSPIAVSQVVGPYLIAEVAQPQQPQSRIQTYNITVYDSSQFAVHTSG